MAYRNAYYYRAVARKRAAAKYGPKLMNSYYAGKCAACQEAFPAGTSILWDGVTRTARHSDAQVCAKVLADRAAAPAPVAPVAPVVDLSTVVAFLAVAASNGIKAPKARFLAPDGQGELMIRMAPALIYGRPNPHAGKVYVDLNGRKYGVVLLTGEAYGRMATDDKVIATLKAIAANPAKAAQEYGALHCRCSFCNLALTDAGSVEVGYGPICAKHWGLPHTPKGTPVLTEEVPLAPMQVTHNAAA